MGRMKKYTARGNETRVVLIGMITDDVVISRISEKWTDEGLFGSRWCNRIGSWCVKYYRRYEKPIGKKLEAVFERWAVKNEKSNAEIIEKIDSFLCGLSNEYEDTDVSSDYILDRAAEVFDRARLLQAMANVEVAIDSGNMSKAYETISELGRVDLGVGSVIKPCEDMGVWVDVYEEDNQESIVPYKGELQGFLGKWLVRDSLIAFEAPDKNGKSIVLMDIAVRALRNRKKVAFFDTGDMSRNQVLRRLGSRIARRPPYPCIVDYPVSVDHDVKDIQFKKKVFKEGMTGRIAYNAIKKYTKRSDSLRLCCYPNSTASVMDIINQLKYWEREGWYPDACIIDYADILAPPPGSHDGLDEIDRTWKLMRRLSQEMHCLVVTATQSSAAAYKKEGNQLLSKKHFSGRKTKLAQVNGMLGINVFPGDKEKGVIRLNWVVRREGAWSESQWFTAAGCWDYYSPFVTIENPKSFSDSYDKTEDNFR